MKEVLIYCGAGIFILIGLVYLRNAFKRPESEEKLIKKEVQFIRTGSKQHLIFLGFILIALGIILLFFNNKIVPTHI